MKTIAIIGAGQLGSRHLQALNMVEFPLSIQVVDVNSDSLRRAQERFNAFPENKLHQISYQPRLEAEEQFDIVIIASNADHRFEIIQDLLQKSTVRHLVLEKLLFCQENEYHAAAELLHAHKVKTWVNCCMRMMAFYQKLQPLMRNTSIQYHVHGSQYGLITNAIHYLDHVAALTGCNQFILDTRYLDKKIIPSKRPGFYEVTGTLIAQFSNNSFAYLHSSAEGNAPAQIEIYQDDYRVIAREAEQKAWISQARTDWQWQEQAAPIPFQSSLTADLVTSLIMKNDCSLPDYASSMQTHLQLLKPLKDFLQEQGFSSPVDYPFT